MRPMPTRGISNSRSGDATTGSYMRLSKRLIPRTSSSPEEESLVKIGMMLDCVVLEINLCKVTE